ncbi:MAG TPA: hypothetical protein VMC43_01355 [Candidatus Paceibacterota bacterium]|nr:hypothetical protein [Candidatus Paceibacterota bacterium]
MIIYLNGSNDYGRQRRERFYLEAFRKKYGNLAVERFDLSEATALQDFQEFARSVSMFQPAKLAVLWNVFAAEAPTLIAELERFVTSDQATTVLISEGKSTPVDLKFLEKAAVVEKFPGISPGKAWDDFVRTEAKARGVHLSAEAGRFLASVYEGDAWRLVTELDKLALLERPMVHQKDLDELGLEAAPNFFDLLSDLKSNYLGDRLAALDRLLAANEPPARAFYTAAYQWPTRLNWLARADAAVKTGRYEYEEALLEAVLA